MFEEVTKLDYDLRVYRSLDFTKAEIDRVSSMYKIKIYNRNASMNYTYVTYNLIFLVVDNHYVYKVEDEWYYVQNNLDNLDSKYYRCDQLDGLLECLKSIYV